MLYVALISKIEKTPEKAGTPLPPESKPEAKTCGIVMPISAMDDCSEAHWAEVLEILSDAIRKAGFEPNIVSMSGDSGLIHKRIVQNLYDNPIVVCDVSARNPNVMFELGMRLAFDKPTVIVKDSKTSYSFDTGGIEHLQYPRDLRFSQIVEFKAKLTEKIVQTLKKSADPNYTTFLKHFGEFTVAKIDKKEVSAQEYILEELKGLRQAVQNMERHKAPLRLDISQSLPQINFCLVEFSREMANDVLKHLRGVHNISRVRLADKGGHRHVLIYMDDDVKDKELKEIFLPDVFAALTHAFRVNGLVPPDHVNLSGVCREL